ncbi:hypothetical protein GNI_136380 [Gregarina niphandrodes]|uniref:Uncharacterized protein n=1 Tax=Gregarina niphandrodes TaxID=110365 RepID=A0A023B111_GRENI|nr:hypothetical protein GNI_136380 [Gregarina niphandrodes]EZG45898.1 hypothetical protein GNI_136380 [Gregarina niphandrodes]|eukprot:XP_011132424.1 hypothetical protein GNI_136380 [Gregarina niphandrodes]
MKYADAVPDMRYDSEAAYAFRLWFTEASHIPCYSTRLYGPVRTHPLTPDQWKNTLSKDRQMWAAEASDYVSCYTLVKSFFSHSANNNLPQKKEVDEIVDELVKNETSSGSFSALALTRAVIDYLLQEWTPPSTTPATPTYCATTAQSSAAQPSSGLSSAAESAASSFSAAESSAALSSTAVPIRGTSKNRGNKERLKERLQRLESEARSLTLMSGIVPEEISDLGVPFAISSTESPPLPLGALMWAYDVLKYDLLHLLPAVYLAKLQNYPTVVELATYASDKVFKGPKKGSRLVCYPQLLYGDCKEEEDKGSCKEVKTEDFRSLVPAEIDQRVKKGKNTERRELRLPTPEQLPRGCTGVHWWANSILANCWNRANPLGSPGDMISQPVFFAMVYSHVCECLRNDFYG